ncbi:MAG: AEC family transporter [Mogibacterium sp.]|nr:AEC family transporter [Mogibacterium sp.]
MLQNFIICVNAVIPSAIYLIVGMALKLFHVVSEEEVKRFTHMTFIALYPFLMFDNLYGKNIGENLNWRLVIYALAFLAFQIISSWVFVCRTQKENYNRGAMIQALFRSNIVLMGLPIGINLFGKGNVTSVAVVLMFVVPIYNVVAVVIFEYFRGGRANWKSLLKGVFTNPLIIGGIVACIVMGLNIPVPSIVYKTVVSLSDATTPIAMILLGASLRLNGMRSDRAKLAVCVIGKLIVFPALGILGAVLIGLRGVDLVAIVLMAATPTALASFAMASSMGGNGELAGETVVFSTVLACFTMPVWLFILMNGGYF